MIVTPPCVAWITFVSSIFGVSSEKSDKMLPEPLGMLLKASDVKTLTLNFFAKVSAILLLYSRYKPCKFKNKVFAQIPFRRVVKWLRPIFIVFVQKNSAALALDF